MAMISPQGCLSLAQQHLKVMLADSTAFRSWVGAADQDQALSRIYLEALPLGDRQSYDLEELRALRPHAIVWTEPQNGFALRRVSVDDGYGFHESGVIRVWLEQDVGSAMTGLPGSVDLSFKNSVGLILDDLAALAGGAGYLDVTEISVLNGPMRSHPDDYDTIGDLIGIELSVSWGVVS